MSWLDLMHGGGKQGGRECGGCVGEHPPDGAPDGGDEDDGHRHRQTQTHRHTDTDTQTQTQTQTQIQTQTQTQTDTPDEGDEDDGHNHAETHAEKDGQHAPAQLKLRRRCARCTSPGSSTPGALPLQSRRRAHLLLGTHNRDRGSRYTSGSSCSHRAGATRRDRILAAALRAVFSLVSSPTTCCSIQRAPRRNIDSPPCPARVGHAGITERGATAVHGIVNLHHRPCLAAPGESHGAQSPALSGAKSARAHTRTQSRAISFVSHEHPW